MQQQAAAMGPVDASARDIVENGTIWVERRAGHDLPMTRIVRRLLDGGLSMTRHCLRNNIQRFAWGFELSPQAVG